MKAFTCPSCGGWPISYLKFFFKGPYQTYACKNCNVNLKIDFSYIEEFFLYFFICAIVFITIDKYYEINYDYFKTIFAVFISFFIMNYKKRRVFKII